MSASEEREERTDSTETPVIDDETAEPDETSEVTAATADTDTITMSVDDSELIPIPPTAPRSGASILGHKLWIGNLDKRLTE